MTVPSSVPGATRSPVAYDFRRPMTLPREHARMLEMAFGTFSRHWANQLVARLPTKEVQNIDGPAAHPGRHHVGVRVVAHPGTGGVRVPVVILVRAHDPRQVIAV